jgi:hypothetical protein
MQKLDASLNSLSGSLPQSWWGWAEGRKQPWKALSEL